MFRKRVPTFKLKLEIPMAQLTQATSDQYGAQLQALAATITQAIATLPAPVDDAALAAGVNAVQAAVAQLPTV